MRIKNHNRGYFTDHRGIKEDVIEKIVDVMHQICNMESIKCVLYDTINTSESELLVDLVDDKNKYFVPQLLDTKIWKRCDV